MSKVPTVNEIPMAKVIDPPRADWDKEGLQYWEDVAYGSQSPRQVMDLWAPRGGKNLPCVIWIHGGGWSAEDLTKRYRPEMEMVQLSKLGFVCVSIEYRLAQHAPFPAQIQDCKCAVRFLRAHAGQYGIDPDHIGVWGESAGGHLASLLAVSGGVAEFEGDGGWNEYSSAVQAAVPWYAPNDLVRESFIGQDPTEMPETGEVLKRLFGGTIQQAKDQFWAASPMKYAGANQPPMLLMHGDMDRLVPTWQTLEFYKALRERGNPVEMILVPGQGHGFFDGEQYYAAINDFFLRTLKK